MSLKDLIPTGPGAPIALSNILSYMNLYEMSQCSLVCSAFSKAYKAAVLLREYFSEEEYEMMFDLKTGVGGELLFQLCNSPGINFQKQVESTIGEHDIFVYACYKGFSKAVHCLLFHIRHPTSESLAWAAYNNNISVVTILLEDERIDPSYDHNLPLRLAAGEGHKEIVEMLLSKSSIDPKDLGNVALNQAIKYKHLDVADVFIKDGRVEFFESLEDVLELMDV